MSDDRYPLQETNRDEEFLFFSGNTEDQAWAASHHPARTLQKMD